VERCLHNLGVETLDLVQLHTPPSEVFERAEVFDVLDELCHSDKIRYYGASVEKVSEALKVMDYPNLQVIQIIFNVFCHKPAEEFFSRAREHEVGILARVPLASGLLTGKMTPQTRFHPQDHRTLIYGGETFAGGDLALGLEAVEELKRILPEGMTLAQLALRWILMYEAVTCAIPGAKRPSQVIENAQAADLPPLNEEIVAAVQQIYDDYIREHVHHLY
jgi:aryl-alcohol dehydrogenase-like predicted oxidoreductase